MTYRPFGAVTASGISDMRTNNTGSPLVKATPVRFNSSGEIDFIDVSIESEALSVAGAVGADIPDSSSGSVVTTGKILNITTTANFGDLMYVSKAGGLTNQKPSIGIDGFISGDFVIMVGVIAKNTDNPGNKDLILNIGIVGQL